MHNPFDFFAKALIEAALDGCCEVRVQHPVSDETLYADTVIDPIADARELLTARGMLGRIARERCLIELFSGRVGLAELDVAMARASMLRRSPGSSDRTLWVITPFRPEVVLRAWSLEPSERWGEGVYIGRARRGPRVIVTSELEATRDTLVLRLMGREGVLLRAIDDAFRLPDDAWERRFVDRLLLRVHRDLPRMVGGSNIPEEFMLRYQQILKEERDRLAEARALGEAQGEVLGEANALRAVLHARGFTVTHEFEQRIGECRDLPMLRRWIVAAVTEPSIDRVFSR
jgi:hypothetical protein